jgi:hypothetical protein
MNQSLGLPQPLNTNRVMLKMGYDDDYDGDNHSCSAFDVDNPISSV